MHSSIYTEGRERGFEEGQEKAKTDLLTHLYTRRLNRPLTANEQKALATRIRDENGTQLIDIAVNSTPEEITHWLSITSQP
jgi:flagellar biosynthesis/type III secretory pathway protein FliH